MNRGMREYTKGLSMKYQDEWNCMGFATHIDDWLIFRCNQRVDYDGYFEICEEDYINVNSEGEEYFDSETYNLDYDKALEEFLDTAVDYLIDKFGLRVIEDPEDAAATEDVIAFRVCQDDFHFARRLADGRWYHKQGYLPVEGVEDQDLDNIWGEIYNSRTVYFAVNRHKCYSFR